MAGRGCLQAPKSERGGGLRTRRYRVGIRGTGDRRPEAAAGRPEGAGGGSDGSDACRGGCSLLAKEKPAQCVCPCSLRLPSAGRDWHPLCHACPSTTAYRPAGRCLMGGTPPCVLRRTACARPHRPVPHRARVPHRACPLTARTPMLLVFVSCGCPDLVRALSACCLLLLLLLLAELCCSAATLPPPASATTPTSAPTCPPRPRSTCAHSRSRLCARWRSAAHTDVWNYCGPMWWDGPWMACRWDSVYPRISPGPIITRM